MFKNTNSSNIALSPGIVNISWTPFCRQSLRTAGNTPYFIFYLRHKSALRQFPAGCLFSCMNKICIKAALGGKFLVGSSLGDLSSV